MIKNGLFTKMWIKNRLSTFSMGIVWITFTLMKSKIRKIKKKR
jgi:hypothetical protein